MIFEQIAVGPMQNFSYLIGDEKSREAAIVDPGWEIGKVLAAAKEHGLNIKHILVTHCHYDHINEIKNIFDATGASVYAHKADSEEIKNKGIKNVKIVDEGDKINVGKVKIEVLHTPGHSPGSVCYLADKKLVTGDTLFVENIGRTDLPGGDAKVMRTSLDRLKKLDENIEVYPGHNYGSMLHSTIAHEKKHNFYMR